MKSLLLTVHLGAAELLKIEELELDESEAETLSEKTKKFLKYNFPDKGLNPKTLSTLELIGALGMVYGTRIQTYRLRKKKERAMKPQIVRPAPAPAAQASPAGPVPVAQPSVVPGKTPSEMWGVEPAATSYFGEDH